MYIANYPEDSILRRHCEAAAALDLQHWLAQEPADAVLRRHWGQLQTAAAADAPQFTAVPPARGATAAAAGASGQAPRRGLFAWLGSLFRR